MKILKNHDLFFITIRVHNYGYEESDVSFERTSTFYAMTALSKCYKLIEIGLIRIETVRHLSARFTQLNVKAEVTKVCQNLEVF